jgi:hydroxymethylbilane synthase
VRDLVIGTRGSALALWQARHVAARLGAVHEGEVSLRVIKTAGDRLAGKHPGQFSAKGIFVKEIEDALLAGSVDLAVHSVKDLPGDLPTGLAMGAYPGREDPRDALITPDGGELVGLPAGARIGTTSLRRRAQLLRHRPDLSFTDMRGNVDTRMRKVQQGEVDGLILALAGVTRLGLRGESVRPLPTEICLPAPGQGALGVEARADDDEVMTLLGHLDHEDTRYEVTAERAVLSTLDAGCLVPLAALARRQGNRLRVESLVASPDGQRLLKEVVEGGPGEAEDLGFKVAEGLRRQGAEELLREARQAAALPPARDD